MQFPTVLICVLALPPLALAAVQANQPDTDLASIVRAWENREKRFRSVRLSWNESKFTARGGLYRVGDPAPGGIAKETIPSIDVRHEYKRAILFDGEKVRYSENEIVWFDGSFPPRRSVGIWNGEISKKLMEKRPDLVFHLDGDVWAEAYPLVRGVVMLPVVTHFRPRSLHALQVLKRYTPTKEVRSFDGSRCMILRSMSGDTGVRRTLWLDLEHDYLVRRWLGELNNTVLSDHVIYYRQDPTHGLLPIRWKLSTYWPDGNLQRSYDDTGVEYSINVPIEATEFTLEFPPGTLVTDHTRGTGPRAEYTYLVLPDAGQRRVMREELRRGVTPEILAKTKPGEAGLPRKRVWTFWSFLFAGAVALALCGLLVWRKYRRA